MPRRDSPYGRAYQRARAVLLAQGLPCGLRLACDGVRATSADHDPPLALHEHRPGSGCCVLRPACMACQRLQGGQLAEARRLGRWGPHRRPPSPSRSW